MMRWTIFYTALVLLIVLNAPAYAQDLSNTKIAFVSNRDGSSDEIYVMNPDGTNLVNLTNSPQQDNYPSWSPDGTMIAFTTTRDVSHEIYVMNADGTNQVNLTNNTVFDSRPSWSPDGTKITFESERDGDYEIYVMNADGTNPVNLTNNPANENDPSWSPDGMKIAFRSFRDGDDEIFVMNSDGANPVNLTNNTVNDLDPSWSPDGTKIAFRSERDGNAEIYVMNADGTNQVNLTNNSANDYNPSWSPDGTKITFRSYRDVNSEIYVMNSDGTNPVNLTNNTADDGPASWSPFLPVLVVISIDPTSGTESGGTPVTIKGSNFQSGATVTFGNSSATNVAVGLLGTITAKTPAHTAGTVDVIVTNPDGQVDTLFNGFGFGDLSTNTKITFMSDRDGNNEIYVMVADGSNLTRLTNNPAFDELPSWSADGTKIAFRSDRDGNNEIYVMNADGLNLTRLTNNPASDGEPSWSPDGTKIAFMSHRDGNGEIYVMNADGSNPTRLTNNPAFDPEPSWSHDGTKIAFQSNRDGNFEIYVMNADGSNPTRLTNNPENDESPSWSPDGTKIAFQSFRDDNNEIYVMNADGSNPTRLTNNPAFDVDPSWSPDGTKIVFYSRRDVNDEIYVMNADGTNQVNLTNNPANENDPSWSPFLVPPPPVVTSISPTSGTELGSSSVTITGSSFQSGATVTFGDSSATNVVFLSDSIITAVTHVHPAGIVDVIVTNPDGQADTLLNGFTFIALPVVTSINPASGTELGGTSVTIVGSNFKSGATVAFGDSSATNVVVVSLTTITATTPAHPAGTVDVIPTNPDGQADTLFSGFTFVSIDAITDTVSFDAVGDRAAIEILIDTVKVSVDAKLRDSLLAVSYNVTGVLNPFVVKVFDASGSEPGVVLTSKVIDPAGGLSQLASEGFTRFEDGRVSVGITQGQTLFVAMELSSAAGPSIGVNIGLDPSKSWTFDEIGGVTRWRRGSDFVGLTGDGGFMIRTVTGIMGDVSKFPPGRGTPDGEIGTEDLDFVVDVVLSRISESGVSDVISGSDKVTRFLMDPVDGRGDGADGIVNLFDILFVVDRL